MYNPWDKPIKNDKIINKFSQNFEENSRKIFDVKFKKTREFL